MIRYENPNFKKVFNFFENLFDRLQYCVPTFCFGIAFIVFVYVNYIVPIRHLECHKCSKHKRDMEMRYKIGNKHYSCNCYTIHCTFALVHAHCALHSCTLRKHAIFQKKTLLILLASKFTTLFVFFTELQNIVLIKRHQGCHYASFRKIYMV